MKKENDVILQKYPEMSANASTLVQNKKTVKCKYRFYLVADK